MNIEQNFESGIMALIECIDPECNGKVSTLADFCPHCGAPIKRSELASVNVETTNQTGVAVDEQTAPPAFCLDPDRVAQELIEISESNGGLRGAYLFCLKYSQSEFWQTQADSGNQNAEFFLAMVANKEERLVKLRAVADKGQSLAQWQLGRYLAMEHRPKAKNQSVSPEFEQALAYLREAANSGLTLARYYYISEFFKAKHRLAEDRSTAKSIRQAKFEAISDLADDDFPPAMIDHAENLRNELVFAYDGDIDKKSTSREIMNLLIRAANEGCADAARKLKREYESGELVPISGPDNTFWKKRHDELFHAELNCPHDAYGIEDLLDKGLIPDHVKHYICRLE